MAAAEATEATALVAAVAAALVAAVVNVFVAAGCYRGSCGCRLCSAADMSRLQGPHCIYMMYRNMTMIVRHGIQYYEFCAVL